MHAGARRFGQLCLQRHDLFRIVGGFLGRLAQERQHLCDVRDVLLALLLHIGVLFRVVIAIGHAESALYGLRDVARAVLRVLTGAKIKKCINADAV